MEPRDELLKVLENFLRNPPPLTAQEAFAKRFLPLYRLVIEGTDSYYGKLDFFRNIDYKAFSLDDLVWVRYLLNSVPSLETGTNIIEDAYEGDVWLDSLLKQEGNELDYAKLIRQIPRVKEEEAYF